MPAMQGGSRLKVTARHWHDLAERRLVYYIDLYRSGRWVHYYSQEQFALRMLDVIKAAKIFRDLAGRSWSLAPARDDDLRPAA